jgi:hypothetical protein
MVLRHLVRCTLQSTVHFFPPSLFVNFVQIEFEFMQTGVDTASILRGNSLATRILSLYCRIYPRKLLILY